MIVVLLPGLDGTGYLFKDLLKELPSALKVDVISYASISSLTYYEQAQEIASLYLDKDVLIIGESYSGRVAYELCHLLGERVKNKNRTGIKLIYACPFSFSLETNGLIFLSP